MKRRYLTIKFFLGSTLSEINDEVNVFLKNNNICIGNYHKSNLYKHGSVYQYELVYATLREDYIADESQGSQP